MDIYDERKNGQSQEQLQSLIEDVKFKLSFYKRLEEIDSKLEAIREEDSAWASDFEEKNNSISSISCEGDNVLDTNGSQHNNADPCAYILTDESLVPFHRNAHKRRSKEPEIDSTLKKEKTRRLDIGLLDSNIINSKSSMYYLKKQSSYVFLPNNRFKKIWDFATLIILFYVMVALPYKYAFLNSNEYQLVFWERFDNFVDMFFMIDLIFNFFTPYVDDHGTLVVSKCKIAKKYLMFWFWIDLLTIAPIPLFIVEEYANFLVFTKLLRLPRLYKITKVSKLLKGIKSVHEVDQADNEVGKVKIYQQFFKMYPGAERVILNMVAICLCCHLFACFWNFIAGIEGGVDNWVAMQGLNDANQLLLYLTSLYWIAQTITTVGYGDITPNNYIEQIICILAMLAGVIFFSFTIGTLTSLIADMDAKTIDQSKKLNILHTIKEKAGMSKELFLRLSLMIKYDLLTQEDTYDEFLRRLPEQIKVELSGVIYGELIQGIIIFEHLEQFERNEILSVAGPLFSKIIFQKGESIYSIGEYSREIYFIKNGEASLVIPECDDIGFYTYSQGDIIGEVEVIGTFKRKYNLKVISPIIELLVLDSSSFKNIFFEKFEVIGAKLKLDAEKKEISQDNLYYRTKEKYQEYKKNREQFRSSSQRESKEKISLGSSNILRSSASHEPISPGSPRIRLRNVLRRYSKIIQIQKKRKAPIDNFATGLEKTDVTIKSLEDKMDKVVSLVFKFGKC